MGSAIIAMTLAGAALAYALISHSRAHATRRREAQFVARRLQAGKGLDRGLRLLTGP